MVRRNYKYLWSLLPGCLVILGNFSGGIWVIINTVFSLGILAIAEYLFPENKDNDHDKDEWLPDGLLVTHVLLQIICIASLVFRINAPDQPLYILLLAAISTGINSGASGIVVAHELIHRKEAAMRFFGKLLLFTAGNATFM